MDLEHSKRGLFQKRYVVMRWIVHWAVILVTFLTRHSCLPIASQPDKFSSDNSTARSLELVTRKPFVDYLNPSVLEAKIHTDSIITTESPTSSVKSITSDVSSSVKYEYVVPSVPVIILQNQTDVVEFVQNASQLSTTGAAESNTSRTSELSARRTRRTALPVFGIWPIFGLFRGLSSFGTMYPQWDYDIDKDGLKTSDIYPVKAIKAVKEIIEKTDWDDLFMRMVREVVNDFVNRILNKIFEKKHRSLDVWPSLRIPTPTQVRRLKRSATGQQLWHSSGAHRMAFPDRRSIECNLRDICQAGRLLSRLPALQQLTMQLRSPGHESQWDAFLWGMRKKRCSRILCKRGRAPKGSRVPWHLDDSSSS